MLKMGLYTQVFSMENHWTEMLSSFVKSALMVMASCHLLFVCRFSFNFKISVIYDNMEYAVLLEWSEILYYALVVKIYIHTMNACIEYLNLFKETTRIYPFYWDYIGNTTQLCNLFSILYNKRIDTKPLRYIK